MSRNKNRKQKTNGRNPIVLFAVFGMVAAALLAVGVIVLIRSNSKRGTEPAGATASTQQRGASGGLGGAVVGPELVTNGNFENGPEPELGGPGFTPYELGSTAIPAWTVARGSVDYIGPYWQHADGRRSIDLNGNEPGAIEQTIRTQPGRKYRVTFSLAGNNNGGEGAVKVVIVRAAGARAEFSFDAAGRSYEDMGWVVKTWEFTAVANETILEFASATDVPAAGGPALDRVSVREIAN